MVDKLKILHLEDMFTDAELVEVELKRSIIPFEKLVVDNKADYIRALHEYRPDIVLSDHSLPSFNSLEAMELLKKSDLNIPFILITATISEEFAVNIMKDGASDYILKDRMQRLPNAILNALEKFRLEAERQRYMDEVIASEALLKEAENIADIGGLDIDVKTQLTKWSPGLYHILGLSVGDIEPSFRNFFNCIHPDDMFRVKKEMDNAIAHLDAISLDFRINTCNSNSIKYLHAKLLVERDKYGIPVRMKGFTQDVTERTLSERKLDSVNRELNLLFDTIDEVFFSRDVVNSKLIQISPACEKVYGYTPAEFFTNPDLWSELIYPDDRHIQQENYKRFSKGEIIISRYRIIHKNKDICWVESKAIPGLNENGVLVRVYGVTRDITARKQAEEQIQEASETQAAILNALPPNIILVNEKGKIIAVNESWKKLTLLNNLGMPNYGVGYNYLAISEKATGVNKIDAGKIENGIRNVIQGNAKEFTMEYASLSGTDWFQVVVSPLADKTLKGAVILHINITDRKLAEASLQQSEANLRSVFNNIDLSIILFDTDLKIVSFNNNANDVIFKQFNKKLKVGNAAYSYFPKERRQAIKKAISQVYDKKIAAYETTYTLPGGELVWYDIKWVGVENQDQENVGVILTFKNITEKKHTEFVRENMTADLAQRNKDLEQFTYIISHNLRAPVANIRGLAGLLNDIAPEKPEDVDTLKALSESVNNLDNVILDLNQILQVRSQVNDQIEMVSLPLLLDEIRAGISQMILKNRVAITCNFEAIDELFILKSYLYSIFQNLVVNSIKYRRAHADPVITIYSKIKGNKVFIYFKDNGKGIDMDKYGSHLFGLYKRFDWSVEGKGVGLFMVKMQVESLGGTISVKSELNAGTEFTIEFPKAINR
jgi:PAS domain S-box-containing protein